MRRTRSGVNDRKIASSGAAIFREVAREGNLANEDAVEGADRTSATVTASPAPANMRFLFEQETLFLF